MALKGNLRDFTVTQLLNLINLAKKTGTLIVEGVEETAFVSFQEGKLAYAEIKEEDNSLATILYRANQFTLPQYRTLKARAANMGDKELGLLLINAGYLSRETVIQTLQQHFISVINRLFTWIDGLFQFHNGLLPPNDKITTRIDLENIIIEGSRRLREWELLQDEIPNLDMALKFTDRPGANLSKVNLSVQEWKVVSYINPKNTLRQIARANGMTDIEIRRIVYGLLQAGLVEIIRPENQPQPAFKPTGAFANASKDEQKSLINRIIGRIRSL